MFKQGMDSQGQLSVEYLLLMVVIFAVFGGMITYLIIPSIDAGNDISDVSDASNAINSIANAANIVYANGPGSKRTIRVYIPQDNMRIARGGKLVNTTVTLSDGTTKMVNANTDYNLAGTAGMALPKGWRTITITWNSGYNWITVGI